jgi:hypothetical protein
MIIGLDNIEAQGGRSSPAMLSPSTLKCSEAASPATSHVLSRSTLRKDILNELDYSPICFRFIVLSQRKPVTLPAQRLNHY